MMKALRPLHDKIKHDTLNNRIKDLIKMNATNKIEVHLKILTN